MNLCGVKVWNSVKRYLLAIATIALAAVLEEGARGIAGYSVPFMFYHPALVLIAVYCGRGPALLALALSAAHSAISLQIFSGRPSSAGAELGVLIYIGVGLTIVLITSALQHAARRTLQAEARLRMIQDEVGVGLWEVNFLDRTVLASRSMWRLLGEHGPETPVPVDQWHRHLPPDQERPFSDKLDEHIRHGASSFEHEFSLEVDRQRRVFLARVKIEYAENRSPTHVRAAVVDVTGRKQLEAEQERHIRELQDVDRRRTEFLATLAHELRNPLAPIRHATLLAQSPQASEEQIRWSLSVIERQAGHMARLLEDLLEASRISRGALELRPETVDIAAVLAVAIETARPLIDGKGHRLESHVPSTPIWLHGDPVRLAQVFSNLLTNAAKYTPSGGHIVVSVELVDAQVAVRVRDNGIGIAPDVLPRLFQLFTQADAALEHAEGGLGIGLALVKGLVQLHGGTVSAHSEGLNCGSEFTVRLPRVAAPATAPRAASSDPTQIGSRRILIADDNRDAADSLSALLQLDGHEVFVAYDGEEALRLCMSESVDVALLDIGMPKLDGYEVARRLRAQDAQRHLTLVAITGWGQSVDRTRALEAGFDEHLTKPVTAQALANVLAHKPSSFAAA